MSWLRAGRWRRFCAARSVADAMLILSHRQVLTIGGNFITDRKIKAIILIMRILVTGSSGHLGEAIIRTLQNKKIDYTGIDIKNSDYTSQPGSISDKEFIEKCMKDIDVVIHTATLHKPHVATHTYQDFIDTNLSGTLNLLEEAKRQRVKVFIYTSTTSTFGDMLIPKKNEPAIWVTEETKAISKNILE